MSKKTRIDGEGTIFYRKDKNLWVFRKKCIINGIEKYKTITRKDKTALLKEAEKLVSNSVLGTLVDSNKITIGEWCDKWLWEIKKCEIKPTTFQSYEDKIRNHIKKHLAPIKVQHLTTDNIQKMINTMAENKKSFRTIEYCVKLLKSILKEAMIHQLVIRNVAEGVRLPKKTKKETKIISEKDIFRFIEECKKEGKLGLPLIFLIYSGMRIGELLALKWENVDFETKTIKIMATLKRVKTNYNNDDKPKTQIMIGTPKSEKSNRKLPMYGVLEKILKQQRKYQLENKLKMGEMYNSDIGYVFTNEFGNNLDPNSPQRSLKRVLERCDLKEIHLHSLRHTFASLGYKNGIELKVMQELLGHSVLSMTANIYTHIENDLLSSKMNQFGKSLEQNNLGVSAISGGW
ncbi:MAG: site-specific integrase [Lachnospiraceae bacterium]|jgi:integrase|nr:site-specific integrase [Lachnospiraceae bacterium]